MSEIIIKAESIKKNYDASYALDGIDIEVLSGQILGLIGPNGAGKSTSYNLYSDLLRPKEI